MVTDIHIEEIRTRVAKIWLREDGIIQLVILPDAEYTVADIRESSAGIVKVSENQRHPVLADVRNLKSINRAARQEAAAIEKVNNSVGILINSGISQMIGNVYMNFSKPVIPTRLFVSEAAAIEWLKEFLE